MDYKCNACQHNIPIQTFNSCVFFYKQSVPPAVADAMEKYDAINVVGSGAYGVVWKALNKQTGEVVAIKKFRRRSGSWQACMNSREVKSLCKMNHPNIVKLKEIVRENEALYLVFEYMDCSLFRVMMDGRRAFPESEIRDLCFQVFQGLAYMHRNGYFHRDLKPENLLVSKGVIKIADFGQARETNAQPPYTDYVTTRWYRAPEVLLCARVYGPAVDMWAMGAIMAELFMLRPLFPGASAADEIYRICSVIGSPTESTWAAGLDLARAIHYRFPELPGVNLSELIPSASKEAVHLIASLCSWHPYRRPTAMEALEHPFFQSCYHVPQARRLEPAIMMPPPSMNLSWMMSEQQKYDRRGSRFLPDLVAAANATSSTNVNTSLSLSTGANLPKELEIPIHEALDTHMPPAANASSSRKVLTSPQEGKNLPKELEMLIEQALEMETRMLDGWFGEQGSKEAAGGYGSPSVQTMN